MIALTGWLGGELVDSPSMVHECCILRRESSIETWIVALRVTH